MVISYVRLNSKTLNRIAYRLPRIAELLSRVTHASIFSKLALLSGFYQIRMRDTDVEKTGFCTTFGNFHFKVMPVGCLWDAPSWQFIVVYLDDICIFSSSFEEHVLHLRAVLQRPRHRQLYVKPTKCAWGQTELEFLGIMCLAVACE